MKGKRDCVRELPAAQTQHPGGRGRCAHGAHDGRRMPAFGHAVGRGEPEARLQLHPGGERRDEFTPADAAPCLGCGQRRGQDHGVGVHAAGVVVVVEVQRVRRCAVGERGCRGRYASLADEHRRGACAFPAEKETVHLRDAGGVGGGADHAKGVQHEELDSLDNRRGEARVAPVLVGGHHLSAEPVGGRIWTRASTSRLIVVTPSWLGSDYIAVDQLRGRTNAAAAAAIPARTRTVNATPVQPAWIRAMPPNQPMMLDPA